MSQNFLGNFRKNFTPWNDTVRIADLAEASSQSSLRGMWSRVASRVVYTSFYLSDLLFFEKTGSSSKFYQGKEI